MKGGRVRKSSGQTILSFLLLCLCVFFIIATFFVKIRRKLFGSLCEEGGKIDMGTTKFTIATIDNTQRYKQMLDA